jgi:hypothetical protein
MGNQSQNKQKQPDQPDYEDKPWQTPQFGQKSSSQKGTAEDGSCGCGSNDEKSNKKNSPTATGTI